MAAVQGHLQLVFPQRVAADWAAARPECGECVQLPAGERRRVPAGGGPGRADAAGGADGGELPAAYTGGGDALCWEEAVNWEDL